MAGYGPPPKGEKHGRTPNLGTPDDGVEFYGVEAPPLPSPGKWWPATVEWWEDWVNSPQAASFQRTDWQRLKSLLPMVDGYNRLMNKAGGDARALRAGKDVLGEIRQNESLLGATVTDRLRARLKTSEGTAGVSGTDKTSEAATELLRRFGDASG